MVTIDLTLLATLTLWAFLVALISPLLLSVFQVGAVLDNFIQGFFKFCHELTLGGMRRSIKKKSFLWFVFYTLMTVILLIGIGSAVRWFANGISSGWIDFA